MATVLFSKLWRAIYKAPVNRIKQEKFLKKRLAFVDSIKKTTDDFDKEILILRTDDIGDYILFRNALEFARNNWPGYKITLLGHILWKDMALQWDSEFVDEFIWLEKGRYMRDETFAREFLKSISNKKPEIILAPSYSRNTFIDGVIANLIPAKQKFAWQRNDRELRRWLRSYCDEPFTTFPIPHGLHEFELNKRFMELVTGKEMPLHRAVINPALLQPVNGLPEKYTMLFPGAAGKRKRWPPGSYAKTGDFIFEKYGLPSVVCGSISDGDFVQKMKNAAQHPDAIIDFTGKTTLAELASVIYKSELIVINDTGAGQCSAVLGTEAVVVVNGNSYGRFFPYPKKLYPNVHAIYSTGKKELPYDWAGYGDIRDIKPEQVIEVVDEILSKKSVLDK